MRTQGGAEKMAGSGCYREERTVVAPPVAPDDGWDAARRAYGDDGANASAKPRDQLMFFVGACASGHVYAPVVAVA